MNANLKNFTTILIIATLTSVLTSCAPKGTYIVKIPKGKHKRFSVPRVKTTDSISGILYINSSMIYQSENNGISKICGFSDGINHHKNSARLGWICIDSTIWICSYCYKDGVSPQQDPSLKKRIKPVSPGNTVRFVVERKHDQYIFSIDDITWKCEAGKQCWFGWFLKPYIGGTYTNDKVTVIKQDLLKGRYGWSLHH